MALILKFHKEAFDEFIEAYYWYETKQPGLGDRFMKSVEEKLQQINDHPEYYTILKSTYRHVKVPDFPFTIVYEFFPSRKFIHISAIHHVSKHPKKRFRKDA